MINLEFKAEVQPLAERLKETAETGRKQTAEALQTCAAMIRDQAKILCPVKTGKLQKSIQIRKETEALSVGVSAGGGEASYARFVEYGTSRKKAQPFMRAALALAKLLVVKAVGSAWRKALEGEVGA